MTCHHHGTRLQTPPEITHLVITANAWSHYLRVPHWPSWVGRSTAGSPYWVFPRVSLGSSLASPPHPQPPSWLIKQSEGDRLVTSSRHPHRMRWREFCPWTRGAPKIWLGSGGNPSRREQWSKRPWRGAAGEVTKKWKGNPGEILWSSPWVGVAPCLVSTLCPWQLGLSQSVREHTRRTVAVFPHPPSRQSVFPCNWNQGWNRG